MRIMNSFEPALDTQTVFPSFKHYIVVLNEMPNNASSKLQLKSTTDAAF